MKSNKNDANIEGQLLNLLKQILPSATGDAATAGKVYEAVEKVLKQKARVKSFLKFCEQAELVDLSPQSILAIREGLKPAFGASDITLKPDEKAKALNVEVFLPDGSLLKGKIDVKAKDEGSDEQAIVLKFVPFPVVLPGDPELVWMLSKQENLSAQEATMSLARLEEEFWCSKTGQKLLRDRVERSFPEFISRVSPGALKERGLKRLFKQPEAVATYRPATPEVHL